MCGRLGIRRVGTCRGLMTLFVRFSRCFWRVISVCPSSFPLLLSPYPRFLLANLPNESAAADPESFDVSLLPSSVLEALEADSFWCLSKLLDGIQDNYIFAQPGILRQVKKMESLCARVDGAFFLPLSSHSFVTAADLSLPTVPSPSCSPSCRSPVLPIRRVHPVRLPVDELPPHARVERPKHRPNVGYLPRTSPPSPPLPSLRFPAPSRRY